MSFSRYSEYQFTGLEVLQYVPANWKVVPAKYLLSFLTSGSRGWAEYYAESGGLFFRIANLDRNSIRPKLDSIQHVAPPDRGEGERARIEEGDILVSITADLGSVCCACKKVSGGYVSQHVALARPIEKICDSNWLAYFISGQVAKEQLLGAGYGGTKVQLSLQDIRDLIVSLPSKEEQKIIAAFLDHETAKIDALIAEQQCLIELLKEKRQAVIPHAVTKGLNPNAPMKDSGVEWLGEVPAHWECMSYRYATRILRGKFGHRPRNDPALYDGDYPFIQTGDIARASKYISKFKQTLNEKGAAVSASFPAGTLVMAIAANIGDTAILGFEAYAPDSVVGFRPRSDINLEYLRYSLDSSIQELEKTSTQSTQANLNIDRVGAVKAVFPPEIEQVDIVNYLDGMCSRFADLIRESEDSIKLMTERRSALISAAVTGKIDVRDWQPSKSTSPEPVLQAAEEAASYG